MESEKTECQIDGVWHDNGHPVVRRDRVIRNTAGIRPGEYAAVPLVELLDERRCGEELLQRMHPAGLACGCGSRSANRHGYTRAGFQVWRCRSCGTVYTLLSGTPLSGTKLDARRLVLFFRMWAEGRSTAEIGREIGMHRNSVQTMMIKLAMYDKHSGRGE